jgi:hypothetical protein
MGKFGAGGDEPATDGDRRKLMQKTDPKEPKEVRMGCNGLFVSIVACLTSQPLLVKYYGYSNHFWATPCRQHLEMLTYMLALVVVVRLTRHRPTRCLTLHGLGMLRAGARVARAATPDLVTLKPIPVSNRLTCIDPIKPASHCEH